ncbi:cyclic AMP receptor 1 [Echria macrotheca]|uniref:Cyclic AMP receptor 1 n=1 Tax=Echria macrotheca TaxID=438768 RepID=A0AAJ0BMZ9_9PEZI|nr:cyclic AMP receptor 1 [Echria macrotheca]
MRGITDSDADAIVAIERACSVLSLLGCVFVLLTFSCSEAFRQRAINRMVFFATFGNMLTNVATLMTRTYTSDVDSFGCQLQGFLIQVFMQGDAYWALAMAVNVYLTFYHKFDARALRKMEIPYFLCCYGIPFIPGFTFLFVRHAAGGRPYGNAVLWCWLNSEWEVYRIATFYGPVWLAILIAIAIYLRAGREIYKKRKRMLNFSGSGANGTVGNNEPFSPGHDLFAPGFKITEVVQTTEIVQKTASSTPGIPKELGSTKTPNVASYSVTISADAPVNDTESLNGLEDADSASGSVQSAQARHPRISSSARPPPTGAANMQARRRFQRNVEAHKAIWSYTKCALLFFAVLLITWIPSSGNRVYTLINNGDVSRPLFFASAFVLPLQGFWNAVIYAVTSWTACKQFWVTIVTTIASRTRRPIVEITANRHHRDSRTAGGMWKKAEETTSMEDLTGSTRTQRTDRVSPV